MSATSAGQVFTSATLCLLDFARTDTYPVAAMGTAPDAVKRLVDARDITVLTDRCHRGQMSDISDRLPSPADRKVFLSGEHKRRQSSKVETPQEQGSIQCQVAATDRQIDAMTYELCVPTETENGIVEGVSR